jgi:hypothetical protein
VGPHDVRYPISTEGLRSFTKGRPCSFVLEGGALLLLSIPRNVEVDEVVDEVEACCSVASSIKRRRRNDLQINCKSKNKS